MKKVTFLLYKEEKEGFLEKLQKDAFVHISNIREKDIAEEFPDLVSEQEYTDRDGEKKLAELERALHFLEKFENKGGVLSSFIDLKIVLSPEQYAEIIKSLDTDLIQKANEIERNISEIHSKISSLNTNKENLLPWIKVNALISSIKSTDKIYIDVGFVKKQDEKILEDAFSNFDVDFEIVYQDTEKQGIIAICSRDESGEVRNILSRFEFEPVDIGDIDKTPREAISDIERKIFTLKEEEGKLIKRAKKIAKERDKFLVYYDYLTSHLQRERVLNNAIETETIFIIEGWFKKKDEERLKDFLKKFEYVDAHISEPEPNEEYPVEMENKPAFRPFEVITELYGLPRRFEFDPSPLMSIFFALFFAFCLTDAGYGIVLIILGLFLLKKIPGGERFLWVLIIGGIFTIFAGALTGGWFGNIDSVFPFLGKFKTKFMWFDPFKDPLKFFFLSLIFAVVQILFGYGIGFMQKIRRKAYLDGIANELSWIVFWLLMFVAIGGKILHKDYLTKAAFLEIIPVVLIIGFSWRSNAAWKQLLKGFYSFYNGFFGFVGDTLSYSRIMALGMVTAGIAMAVNIMVNLVKGFPVVGIILAILIFIGGHLFSIAINTLGAFVHTLRLQYVEFFTKFYEGGGKKFTPFGYAERYTMIRKIESR